jgi:hypothetical protein
MAGMLFLFPAPDELRGRQLYVVVSVFGFVYALLAGVLLTAGAINEEREQGTLGLLFLTDLRSQDILLGKLLASSLNGSYVLVGLLPLLMVPLMFGGVVAPQVLGHAALLVSTLLLSLAIGLRASVFKRDPGQAIRQGLGQMAACVLVPLVFAPFPLPLLQCFAAASPLLTFIKLFFANSRVPGSDSLWLAMGVVWPLGLALLAFAGTTSRLTAADAALPERAAPLPRLPQAPLLIEGEGGAGDNASRLARARRGAWGPGSAPPEALLESDPVLWLLWRRNRFPRADIRMVVLFAVIAVPVLLASLSELGWFAVLVMAFVLHLLALSHMASQASQRIATLEEREALELLLTTPRGAAGTLASYHRGFCQLFQMQFWALVVIHAMLLCGAVMGAVPLPGSWLIPAIALPVLFAERSALSWMGLSLSLRHGRYHRAHLGVLLGVVLPSVAAVAFAVVGPGLLRLGGNSGVWWLAWLPWLVVGGALPFALAAWHRRAAARWLHAHGAVRAEGGAA